MSSVKEWELEHFDEIQRTVNETAMNSNDDQNICNKLNQLESLLLKLPDFKEIYVLTPVEIGIIDDVSREISNIMELSTSENCILVLETLIKGISHCPEFITLGICQVKDISITGIYSEVLSRTMPMFTGLPGSLPSSDVVMNRLLEVAPDFFVLQIRIAFKQATTTQDFYMLEEKLRRIDQKVCKQIDEEATIDEMIGYWCFKADTNDINLGEKIFDSCDRKPTAAIDLVSYLTKLPADAIRKRGHAGGITVVSVETFGEILRVLNELSDLVSADDLLLLNTRYRKLASTNSSSVNAIASCLVIENSEIGGDSSFNFDFNSNVEQTLLASPVVSDDVEEEANAYFQKIYTSEITVADAISLLKQFKSSDKLKEQEIFRCMIHNLFDEYRFFHKYPEKELYVTAELFGSLVQNHLVSSITLGIALRYVLEALKKEPDQSSSYEKMFNFGKIVVEQFRQRLGEWPQYCSHIIQIPHFSRHCPELFQEAQRSANSVSSTTSSSKLPSSTGSISSQQQLHESEPSLSAFNNESVQQQHKYETSVTSNDAIANDDLKAELESDVISAVTVHLSAIDNTLDSKSTVVLKVQRQRSRDTPIIDRMLLENNEVNAGNMPPDNIRDQILFIVNNIAKDNFASKIEDLRLILWKDHYNWFANYLVVKRISTMPNLHPIYLSILDYFDSTELFSVILDTTLYNATKLLQSSNITTSTSERSLLRNLGIWLGQITLARNKPLLHRRMDLKALLKWGYESARLIAVCSFIARIIEAVKESKIFKPPNPWLMGILGVLRELYDMEDLKMNIKFEVQVLCKNINIRIEDVPRGGTLALCKVPIKDNKNPDFTLKTAAISSVQSSPLSSSANASNAVASSVQIASTPNQTRLTAEEDEKQPNVESGINTASATSASAATQEQTVIPNLASYVTINQSLSFFTANPNHRRLVPLAVDRAIREIIQPVVERSVSIANVTTKHLIVKDFATEPSENQLRSGAHLMISNLAGSLALVTCKEPLRISISNHLRTLLSQSNVDQVTIEQIVQVCSNDNLELGRILIEKAATEKAIRDIDDNIANAIQVRKKARESNQQFVDMSYSNIRFYNELPELLKPKSGGLSSLQFVVYETFQRARQLPAQSNASASTPATTTTTATIAIQESLNQQQTSTSMNNINALSMAQSLEAYQVVFNRLDLALKTVQIQAAGRDVSIAMLGTDHEILSHFRDMIIITQRTSAGVRSETAMQFCETLFKRLMESISSNDMLRVEVVIGIIEAFRDACGGAKKFSPDLISWLSHYINLNFSDEASRKIHRCVLLLLLRAKLVRAPDLDVYFATCMDSGRNTAWVEVSLLFIRQCIMDGHASIHDFSNSFDTVTNKIRPTNPTARKQIQKWISDLRAIGAPKEEPKSTQRDTVAREHVAALLEKWLRIWNSTNDHVFGQYLQIMHQFGVLKTEENADRFFRLSTELCIEACLKTGGQHLNQPEVATALTYTIIDALSRLFILLVRLADKEAGDSSVRVNLLNRILTAIGRAVIDDHDAKKSSKSFFDQRPYYRLLLNLSQDLGLPDPKSEPNPAIIPLLTSYFNLYHSLQPSALPGFSFSWLQLISHRSFMPNLLLMKGQKCWQFMHRLIMLLLLFLQPFLRSSQLNDSIRRLYKGTLRVLLVLLHDFPEFLCDYHLSFCDVIPNSCVQLRNLVLSAFPRTMRLPDPFIPNLKVDLLLEITKMPTLCTDFITPLNEKGIRQRIDSYMVTKQPADVPTSLVGFIKNPGVIGGVTNYNLPLFASIIVYVGTQAVVQLQTKTPLQNSPSMDIFKQMIASFDSEGRYHFFNMMANQLRYPNSHTHYFSCVILWIFAEAENEFLQEQITRVLLERLIVHRPHPWGLLITFIELIKNPRYAFWRKAFVHSTPEIERVFEAVAKSCMGGAASTFQQQQTGIAK